MSRLQTLFADWRGVAGINAGILFLTAIILATQGRYWICTCNEVWFWSGDIWSSHNSQHIFDPYTFTHFIHGLLFYWFTYWVFRRQTVAVQLTIAIALESLWEIVENSSIIINRYREVTLALGYTGDTIVNSVADILICAVGFFVAKKIGWKYALALLLVIELILVYWIRDSLVLNVIMLIYPLDAIREWQTP